jgi:hypothetical protein
MNWSRARILLALAARTSEPHSMIRAALRQARRLRRENVAWASAYALLIRAGVASIRRDTEVAAALLREAAVALEAIAMPLYAAAARRRLGEILGGERGEAMINEADDSMIKQGTVRPDRMTAMYAPGFCIDRGFEVERGPWRPTLGA